MTTSNHFLPLLHITGLIALLLLSCCQSEPELDSQLLQNTLAYHDPGGNWPKLKTRLYLSSADTAGQENTFEIEMDNSTGYFAHISRKDGKEVVKGIADGKEFYLLDGKHEISAEDRKKYGLTPEDLKWVHSFYGYLYGLPMKLTDDGVHVRDAANSEELEGNTYRVLQVNYDASVGSDNWFFYLDPETYAMEAYRFNHGQPESGEYILLEQEVVVEGIRIPKVRKWYWNKNNAYIGTDSLIKAEPLTTYRI
ncbi:hypothetical protein DXT99_10440 [Pontibacter diazotrophicus]|uniref:Outer membrane lipoprotein-sorting protein n=1 Tax=Pontibacter diazotrophicus TaxID=1400979 RepID=A0A3D8LCS8_9BACT|nr:DUF6503 family protein [Pontibacter diazotrophicus]RDV15084.1 hypothetical protein DXT99_10440 [Pontibacter diazotrophicus]